MVLVTLVVSCVVWPNATARETALDRYVAKPDPAYQYSVVSTIEGKRSTTYILSMTSQQFLTKADVDRTLWKHWMVVVKPHRLKHETSLIVIDGGSNGKEPPEKAEDFMSQIAVKTGSVVTGLGMGKKGQVGPS